MSVCTHVQLLLLLPTITFASHFWGGSVSFSPKGMNSDGSYELEMRYKQTFDSCGYFFGGVCLSGSCGFVASTETKTIYSTGGRNPDHFNWCQTEEIVTRTIADDQPFSLLQVSCCWVSLTNGFSGWRLLTVVDLGKRSDTNEPNRSPVTTSISFVRVPQNCPRTYKLITFDPDNDEGRCRYGVSGSNECEGCQIPTGFALNQARINEKDFCTVSYTNASTGVYGLEVVVEDFPQQTITLSYRNNSLSLRGPYGSGTGALSQIPLHFAVKVEPAIASCEEGVYLPKFIAPTPANGETIHANINQELEIIVNTTASASSIHDLIISGPLNIAVNSYGNSTTQFVLRWTPRTEDLGEYFPVCFVAESNHNIGRCGWFEHDGSDYT
ncbi:uncharacterized protein LOC134459648 isoform X2 [Engraulis encrasicolus]|uniref:uncharacterized protein LOC134459648 isoform X2 n=1 Tax=Engraulis encrasicolus TaxID=184585 RepID=UPI002FCFD0F7